jgi:hypothetical protein
MTLIQGVTSGLDMKATMVEVSGVWPLQDGQRRPGGHQAIPSSH